VCRAEPKVTDRRCVTLLHRTKKRVLLPCRPSPPRNSPQHVLCAICLYGLHIDTVPTPFKGQPPSSSMPTTCLRMAPTHAHFAIFKKHTRFQLFFSLLFVNLGSASPAPCYATHAHIPSMIPYITQAHGQPASPSRASSSPQTKKKKHLTPPSGHNGSFCNLQKKNLRISHLLSLSLSRSRSRVSPP
jgi:hypothetical protein